jgi:hypothetical protein
LTVSCYAFALFSFRNGNGTLLTIEKKEDMGVLVLCLFFAILFPLSGETNCSVELADRTRSFSGNVKFVFPDYDLCVLCGQ